MSKPVEGGATDGGARELELAAQEVLDGLKGLNHLSTLPWPSIAKLRAAVDRRKR